MQVYNSGGIVCQYRNPNMDERLKSRHEGTMRLFAYDLRVLWCLDVDNKSFASNGVIGHV